MIFLSQNEDLKQELDSILYNDQYHREKIASLEKQFGSSSKEVDSLFKLIEFNDSINLIKVENFLETYDWCGIFAIGKSYSTSVFLVIQHSNPHKLNEYLPELKEAFINKCLSAHNYSLIIDRTAVFNGEKQTYGTQLGRFDDDEIFFIYELKTPRKVNKRRNEIGLPPLELYVNSFGIEWSLKFYRKTIKKYKKSKSK